MVNNKDNVEIYPRHMSTWLICCCANKKVQMKRKLGTMLITSSVLLWLIDRFSYIISSYFSRLLCGDYYLQPVDGIYGDVSCGFNADMHFTALMFLVLITGIVLLIIAIVQGNVH